MYKSNIQKEAKEIPESDTEPVFISILLAPSSMADISKSSIADNSPDVGNFGTIK